MDRVRLGRALGYGVRQAAKTAVAAVEAAAAPNPRAHLPDSSSSTAGVTTARPRIEPSAVAERVRAVGRTAGHAGRQSKGLGRSVWSPLARFSGVLWLEVTGTFFAVMALYLGQGVWRHRAMLQLGLQAHEAQKVAFSAMAFVVFAYFAVSNFLKAQRRGRR